MAEGARSGNRRATPEDGELFAALDIGCSKIACVIARADSRQPGGFAVAAGGRQQSRGFSGGTITDMDGLERCVRLAVEDAETRAGARISQVALAVTGPRVTSRLLTARHDQKGREITARDIRKSFSDALSGAVTDDRAVLSAWPVGFRVDGEGSVRDPSGMAADAFEVHVNLVTAPRVLVRNLTECVSRSHLKVERMIPSSVASGLATLIDDELDNGAICIDMGAGVSALAAFLNGGPAWTDLVPAGGALVTADLAQGLGTTFAAAEKLKAVHGHADHTAPGLRETVDCPIVGDDGRLHGSRVARARLAEIIAPRIEETFELIARRIAASTLYRAMPRRAVLTGGASQLEGVRDVAARTLNMPVRLARPNAGAFLGEDLDIPGFSTAAGLLQSDRLGSSDVAWAGAARMNTGEFASDSVVNRTWHWLKENF